MAIELNGMRIYTLGLTRRAIKDIRRDNFRQVRKYVDLCAFLSKGRGHKLFFERVQHILEKTDSLYYPLIQRGIETIREDAACTFGVNLGIDAMTFGARRMQQRAAAGESLAPWLSVADPAEPGLDLLMTHREDKGQYLWVLWARDEAGWQKALTLADRHPKAALALVVPPALLDEALADALTARPNLMTLLPLECPEVSEALCAATRLLRERRLLYGVTIPLTDDTAPLALQGEWQSLLAQHSLCCIYTTAGMSAPTADALTRQIWKLRMTTGAQCLPLLWEADTAYVSERLAPGAWLEDRTHPAE